MIVAERGTPLPHRFSKDKLVDRKWHKYVIHKLRHGNKTERLIATAKAWLHDNALPGKWMVHTMNSAECALFYVEDDQDAVLFELGQMLQPGDKRGKKDWSK